MSLVVAASIRTFGTTVLTAAIGLATSVIAARFLGPEARGLFSAAILVASLAGSLSQWGLPNGLVYFVGTRRPFNAKRAGIASILIVGFASAAVGVVLIPFIADGRLAAFALIEIAVCIATGLSLLMQSASQMDRSLALFNRLRVIVAVGNFVLLVGCVLVASTGNWGALVAAQMVVACLVFVLGAQWLISHVGVDCDLALTPVGMREVASYALATHGGFVVWTLATNVDKLLLASKDDMAEFGYYSVAFGVSRLVGAVQNAVASALFSRYAGGDAAGVGAKFALAFRLTLLPMLIVVTLLGLLCPVIVPLAYGEAFGAMTVLLIVLMYESVISSASRVLAQRFAADGRPKLMLMRQVGAVIPMLLALPFVGMTPRPALSIALLTVVVALFSLLLTMQTYRSVYKEPLPPVLPSLAELGRVLRPLLARWR